MGVRYALFLWLLAQMGVLVSQRWLPHSTFQCCQASGCKASLGAGCGLSFAQSPLHTWGVPLTVKLVASDCGCCVFHVGQTRLSGFQVPTVAVDWAAPSTFWVGW